MAMLVTDPELEEEIRQERGAGRDEFHYEVWDGVTMMTPIANNEHQGLARLIGSALVNVVNEPNLGDVFVGVNVSDRSRSGG